jgi:DNA processing protein
MIKAVLFKILQRRNKYRNSESVVHVSSDMNYSQKEFEEASSYLRLLHQNGIKFTYPGDEKYPKQLLKMKEPPLFLEYIGDPLWCSFNSLSVVGSREIETATATWIKEHLEKFLTESKDVISIVSGGATGVDQLAHFTAIKAGKPTVFVLPSGLMNLYPRGLDKFMKMSSSSPVCFLSEFELTQQIHKSHFYFRNRIIAALGEMTLVAQASMRSGTLLTVHHCLEIGRPVLVIPAHPAMHGFAGNIKLLQDGAYLISNFHDLHEIWVAETRPQLEFV